MPGIVLAQPFATATRSGKSAIPERVVFMIAHDDLGGTTVYHIPHHMQRLTDPRAAVNDVANKHGLAPGVLIYTVDLTISHLVKQSRKRVGTAMNVANYIKTTEH
jgi:hypothetical protein